MSNIVVMPGAGRVDLPVLHAVAGEFGWDVTLAHCLSEVTAPEAYGRRTTAVLFHQDTFGSGYSWRETIRRLKLALPEVRLVACHGFAEPIDWPVLSEAGAFHSLWLPLKESEVRRSLGFVWEAERRSPDSARESIEAVLMRSHDVTSFNRVNQVSALNVRSMVSAAF